MSVAIGGFFLKAILIVLVMLAASVVIRARFRGVLRLGPGIRTPLRYRWAVIPSRAARLHRRLQVIVGVCVDALTEAGGSTTRRSAKRRRAGAGTGEPVADAHGEIQSTIDEAAEVDAQLVPTSKARGSSSDRRKRWQALDADVARVEARARRALSRLRQAAAETKSLAPDTVIDERPDADAIASQGDTADGLTGRES